MSVSTNGQAGTVENVIAQKQSHIAPGDIVGRYSDAFRYSARALLLTIGNCNSPTSSIAQQIADLVKGFGAGDGPEIPQATKHERSEWIVNHWLVVDRQ
jgi:hypothetical protein